MDWVTIGGVGFKKWGKSESFDGAPGYPFGIQVPPWVSAARYGVLMASLIDEIFELFGVSTGVHQRGSDHCLTQSA